MRTKKVVLCEQIYTLENLVRSCSAKISSQMTRYLAKERVPRQGAI